MEMAAKEERRPLRLGDRAPDFRARTTAGDLQLSSLRGRWVIFFSHPADFTPVCSTEFTELARRQAEFDAVGCMLVGLSVDSLHSHWAWIRALQEVFGVQVRFPIVEDPSMAIGRAYGMIDEQSRDSTTMRTTFFIDPEGVIRATTCYPHDVGRSVEEMLRLLKALQKVSSAPALTPEGWTEGRPVLRLPPDTPDAGPDWFCRFEGTR
ncbi:MAG: redoxin domain-containing protein [Sphingomonadales bacterium]|nr:MAG: redoxin domain-containing protein [Sphingomonadales bacterium]